MIRVIIAEDFQILREDLKKFINSHDNMTVVADVATGKALVEVCQTTQFDVALVDIEMEEMNSGIVATQSLLEKNPNLKIIFLTVHETEEMILTAMATGAVDYVVKGEDKGKIIDHILAAYNGEYMLSTSVQNIIAREYTRLRRSEMSLLFFINNIGKLTTTEKEIIGYLLKDFKVQEIANARSVELVTIKTQIKGILRKFNCFRTKEIVNLIRQLRIEQLFD